MSLVEELKNMTATQLKAYAKENNIDLVGCKTKAEILEMVLNFVPIQEFPNQEDKKEIKKYSDEKVAVHSTRNLHWTGVGELKAGYNIVTKEASEDWLTLKHVRLATPQEVARHYGVK